MQENCVLIGISNEQRSAAAGIVVLLVVAATRTAVRDPGITYKTVRSKRICGLRSVEIVYGIIRVSHTCHSVHGSACLTDIGSKKDGLKKVTTAATYRYRTQVSNWVNCLYCPVQCHLHVNCAEGYIPSSVSIIWKYLSTMIGIYRYLK